MAREGEFEEELEKLTNSPLDDHPIALRFIDIWAVDEFRPYKSEEIIPLLQVGDEVWLKLDTQGYSHVLLYIGNGEVVHVASVEKPGGIRIGKTIIRRDKLDDVGKDHMVGYRRTENLSEQDKGNIVRRALNEVGKYKPYLLTTDNCEHQVKYWISGVKDYRWITSTQVRDYVVIGIGCGLVGAVVAGGLVVGLWSTEIYVILIAILLGGLAGLILGLGIKYIGSALEHRQWFSGNRVSS